MPISKNVYKCGICGKEHNTVEDRARCELKCSEERAKAEAEMKAAKLKEEQKQRKAEVDDAFERAYELKEKYMKDYGFYSKCYSSCEDCDDEDGYDYDDCFHSVISDLFRILP